MRLFIDGDGCPVVRLAVSVAQTSDISCTIVCDTSHEFSIAGVEVLRVGKGADSADFALVNRVSR